MSNYKQEVERMIRPTTIEYFVPSLGTIKYLFRIARELPRKDIRLEKEVVQEKLTSLLISHVVIFGSAVTLLNYLNN